MRRRKFVIAVNFPYDAIVWNDGSSAGDVNIEMPGLYWAQITSAGCSFSDSIMIYEKTECGGCVIKFPNAFTPNYDGVNDIFKYNGNCEVSFYHLIIFNRWGEKVFETFDPAYAWDGKVKNQTAGIEVYTYIAEYITNNDQDVSLQGNITLIR